MDHDGQTLSEGKTSSNSALIHDHGKETPGEFYEALGTATMQKTSSYPRVSVIIPALNEAKNLPHVLPYVLTIASEVILVDGHSTDDTVEIAQRLMPTIKITKQTGKGKGNALQCGLAVSTGDVIVMMDADGSTDPKEIPRFVQAILLGADLAKGSRFLNSGGSADITRLRRWGNHLLRMIVNWLFQTHFTDLCYGYIACWQGSLDFIELDSNGFEIETQIILRARKANLKIVEVPSYEHLRLHGASHLKPFRDGWRVLRTIWQEWSKGYSGIKTPGWHRLYQSSISEWQADS